jgi:hypothetical protein
MRKVSSHFPKRVIVCTTIIFPGSVSMCWRTLSDDSSSKNSTRVALLGCSTSLEAHSPKYCWSTLQVYLPDLYWKPAIFIPC